MIEYPRRPGTPKSHLPFSPATKVGNLLFVSGQASVDRDGALVEDDFAGQMRRSLANLAAVLEDCGSGLAHIVMTRNYVHDPADLAEFNRLYAEFFAAPYPARTTITSCLTEQIRYEIDCIAVVPDAATS